MELVKSETTSNDKSSYPMANFILVVLIVFSIASILNSLELGVVCILLDIFAILSIQSMRRSEENQESSGYSRIYMLMLFGIAVVLLTFMNSVSFDPNSYFGTVFFGICFVLAGLSLLVNRSERNRSHIE